MRVSQSTELCQFDCRVNANVNCECSEGFIEFPLTVFFALYFKRIQSALIEYITCFKLLWVAYILYLSCIYPVYPLSLLSGVFPFIAGALCKHPQFSLIHFSQHFQLPELFPKVHSLSSLTHSLPYSLIHSLHSHFALALWHAHLAGWLAFSVNYHNSRFQKAPPLNL